MMQHRHLTSEANWSKAAIDSALDRGSLAEWRELFQAALRDEQLAMQVVEVAARHRIPGVLPIVQHVLSRARPNLKHVL
jgi:hypothetical protein